MSECMCSQKGFIVSPLVKELMGDLGAILQNFFSLNNDVLGKIPEHFYSSKAKNINDIGKILSKFKVFRLILVILRVILT